VRDGAALLDSQQQTVGRVTSGSFGPSVDAPIAMGYVDSACAKPGTALFAVVRDKPLPVTVTTLPFVLHRYVR
jgi:aminomethyltransferase